MPDFGLSIRIRRGDQRRMPQPDPHVDTLHQRAVRSHLLALRSRLAGDRFLATLDRHREMPAKANFNPAQPR